VAAKLSVVVTIVDGGAPLRRCLRALADQRGAPPLEVIVPYDDSVAVDGVQSDFPYFRFLALGRVATQAPPRSFSGQHELFDRRRAAGLAASTGDLVAILEDRGVPRLDWAATAAALHGKISAAAIGGAIGNGSDGLLQCAVYLCDFGRYQPPCVAGPANALSDVNVCYTRRAVELTRTVWNERYHEPLVHRALARAGETLVLAPELVVDEKRDHLEIVPLCRERIAWGKLYGEIRMRGRPWIERALRAADAPLLPELLIYQIVKDRFSKGTLSSRVLFAMPAVVVLTIAWSIGEMLGYLSAGATPGVLPRRVEDA